MKEMVMPDKIHSLEFDIDIVQYLTMAQIQVIINKMLEHENVIDRQIIKDMLTVQMCTNIEIVDDLDYNLVCQSGLLEEVKKIVVNYNDIDYFISKTETIEHIFSKFLGDIYKLSEKAVDKLPKNNKTWNKIIDKVDTIVNKNDKQ